MKNEEQRSGSRVQNPERLLDENDLAARWKVSVKTLRNARVTGARSPIPFVKIGRSVRYRLSDIETYEAANTRTSTSDRGMEHGTRRSTPDSW